MTQEELLNKLEIGDFDSESIIEDNSDDDEIFAEQNEAQTPQEGEDSKNLDPDHYRVSADEQWPPPPPITDHKVVEQLDDVTKGLEAKAGQVFDQLETISNNTDSVIKDMKKIKEFLVSQKELFEKLSQKFPNIATFKTSLESCDEAAKQVNGVIDKANESADAVISAMDIMQYQDIHRQKIERVVNIMRTLARYLNSMFDTDIDDEKRVSSAVYIEGDKKDGVVDDEDIENLIANLGKK